MRRVGKVGSVCGYMEEGGGSMEEEKPGSMKERKHTGLGHRKEWSSNLLKELSIFKKNTILITFIQLNTTVI